MQTWRGDIIKNGIHFKEAGDSLELLQQFGFVGKDFTKFLGLKWIEETPGVFVFAFHSIPFADGRCDFYRLNSNTEWPDYADLEGLVYMNVSTKYWNKLSFPEKVFYLFNYFGAENVFGTSNSGGWLINNP